MATGIAYADVVAPIGEMRRRIVFQLLGTVQKDEYGQVPQDVAGDWADILTCWAKVEPLGGRELATVHEVFPEANTRFTIRYQPDIKVSPSMRIAFAGDNYDIANLSDISSRHRVLVIDAIQRPTGRND